MNLPEAIEHLRAKDDFGPLLKQIPYASFMGIEAEIAGGDVRGRMAFAEHLLGNARVQALHGGTLGALLECTAIFKLLWHGETVAIPKPINITVEYLRAGKAQETFARAEFTRHGRRVVNVRVFAWQDNVDKPVAVATSHFLLVGQ